MDRFIKWGTIGWITFVAVFGFFVGCAKQEFARDLTFNSCQNSGKPCITQNGFDLFDEVTTIGAGPVDIMIVDDNSASMSTEQEHMVSGHPFANLISNLANMDYHLAITTTDVSASPNNPPRAINQNGALQDGKLIAFTPGVLWLEPSTGTVASQQNLFESTIVRPETLFCENPSQGNFNPTNCPSGDERAIYATILAAQHERSNPSGFFRSDTPFHLIILSDEDERSTGGLADDNGNLPPPQYQMETNDQPQTLVDMFQGGALPLFPDKQLVVHSIIVRPGDTSCKSIQDSQNSSHNIRGYYGNTYAKLSKLTGGTIGNICASDFTSQVGQIAVQAQGQVMELACDPTNAGGVQVTFNPPQANIQPVVDGPNHRLTFSQVVPVGVQVERSYKCVSLPN